MWAPADGMDPASRQLAARRAPRGGEGPHLEAHHEGAGGALAAVEEAGPLEAQVHVVQVQVLPLGLPLAHGLAQGLHVLPRAVARLLELHLLHLVGLLGQHALLGRPHYHASACRRV